MPNKLNVLLVLLALSPISLAQQKVAEYKVRGVVTAPNAEVIAGLNLYVHGSDLARTFVTDINGEFELKLWPGDYEITVNQVNSKDFKAFLKIIDGGLNPNDVEFNLDPDKACCITASGLSFPKPLALPRPAFPPAARATRTSGEVVVDIKIRKDGTVVTANVFVGHPLLRATAELAARSSRFEASNTDAEREATLTYAFFYDDTIKPGTVRYRMVGYKNLYRIEMIAYAASF